MGRFASRCISAFLVFLLALPVLALSGTSLTGSGCSVSVPGYLADLAREYQKETGVRIYLRGGGSVLGLRDLAANTVDFAASCQSKSPSDPEDFEYVAVAWDALVFIVNPSNPVNSVTFSEVRKIYDGTITNWKQLGGRDLPLTSFISTQEGMGGIGETLSKTVMPGRRPKQQANSSLQASSAAIWEQLVEKTPGGFASTGFASARKRAVKMLKVNGVAPSKESIMSGAYRLRRPLYLVIRKDARPEVRKFIAFALSRKGQAFISSCGIPSLADIVK